MVVKRGQVTIFIIIALVIVVAISLYVILRDSVGGIVVPPEVEPVYSYYLSCINDGAFVGSQILGQQGGYIESPDFSPGSSYMPFSSQLNFLGTGVPYWYYISGNGVVREQVPSREKMQSQLNDFVENSVADCDFSLFEEQGFIITFEDPIVSSAIGENAIDVSVRHDLSISRGNVSWSGIEHTQRVESHLGLFYDSAIALYTYQKQNMFLENYAVDILRLYAPVDGIEVGCGTKLWSVDEIRGDLIIALEANIPEVKVKGDYYSLVDEEHTYFVQDIGEDIPVAVNFMYSREWPMKMEVWPSEDRVLRADPVGLQEGLGILGFCYIPYHFVYDFAYPVMMQFYSGTELFQFPVVVYVNKNKAREAVASEGLPNVVPELCTRKNTPVTVYTINTALEPVPAQISFSCFDTTCSIGESVLSGGGAVLTAQFPQCGNGYVVASAEGYSEKKQIVSTIEGQTVTIVLDKKYDLAVELTTGREVVTDRAIISFVKNGVSTTLSYPDMNTVSLTEGQYTITTHIYQNSSLSLEGSVDQKCVNIPKGGIFGVFGATEEKCFDIEIPDQEVGVAISGGGNAQYYIAESELQNSDTIVIRASDFGVPQSVSDLQLQYNAVEVADLQIRFE
jgi:hypothetical protein